VVVELMQQGVSAHVLHCLGRDINEQHDQAARAKRAVASLAYVSGQEIAEISGSSLDTGVRSMGRPGPCGASPAALAIFSAPPPSGRITASRFGARGSHRTAVSAAHP